MFVCAVSFLDGVRGRYIAATAGAQHMIVDVLPYRLLQRLSYIWYDTDRRELLLIFVCPERDVRISLRDLGSPEMLARICLEA